ncbi:MAG TPA: hypothetical protein VFH45_00400 [Acidimicrobiales bacterium]|nr:hypothetical protein [Acidimicrobiales bacterium]
MSLAVQVGIDLYARTVVDGVAFDAARVVAGADAGGTPAALDEAEQEARAELGAEAARASFSWRVTADVVQLTVSLRQSPVIPTFAASDLGLDRVERTVVVRREGVR